MSENNYYKAVVKIGRENDKGKEKFTKQDYLVNAINPTDVEVKINKELEGMDFELVSVVLTKIVSVLN